MAEEIKEICENEGCEPQLQPNFPLWIIHYHTLGDKNYVGLAIVKAPDCHIAERIFKSKSAFNGCQERIRIREIKEVYYLPCPDLLAEEYVPFLPPKLPPKRKIGKTKNE